MRSSTVMGLLLAASAMLSTMGSAHAMRALKWSPQETDPSGEPCWGSCPEGSTALAGSEDGCRTMGCSSWLEQVDNRCYWPCKEGFISDGLKCKQTCPKGYLQKGKFCRQAWRVLAKTESMCPPGTDDVGTGECFQLIVPTRTTKMERFRMHADAFPECDAGLEMGWDGLCYNQCKAGFQGQGPLCVPQGQDDSAPTTYTRGPGSEPNMPNMDWCTKANGYELKGGVCYMECDPGFAPVKTPTSSPMLCVEVCPKGYTDGGKVCIEQVATIAKSTLRTYTRAAGIPLRPVTVMRTQIACT